MPVDRWPVGSHPCVTPKQVAEVEAWWDFCDEVEILLGYDVNDKRVDRLARLTRAWGRALVDLNRGSEEEL